jgi:hypothetical protein
MVEFEHSPLGGSAAKRFLNCGASFLLQRLLILHNEYEQPPTSEFADKGNAAHELAAHCLLNDDEPFEYIGEKVGKYTVHPADLDPEAVAVYVNYCRAIMEQGGNHATSIIEQTFHLRDIHPLFKGTVDFGHWRLPEFSCDPGLWLVDYKNGEGIGVEAYRNPQLMYYAVLLIMAHAELKALPFDFPVHLGIVQPNYWGVFEEPEMWHTTIREVFTFAKQELLPAMEALTNDKRDMIPVDEFKSGDHCQFCPVMLDCPKLREAFETYAHQDEFIEMLKDEEISALYALKDDARRYANELEKVAFARKLGGGNITTGKLVEKMVHRAWKPGAEQAAVQRFKEHAYNPRKLKSPAQMEKLSSDAKAFALEWGFKPESDRLTIAPLTDRRAEAKPITNADVFKNFATPPIENLHDLGW